MNFLSFFRDNANLFLPVFGLLVVVIALSFIDIDSGSFSSVVDLDSQQRPDYVNSPKMVLEEGIDYKALVVTNYGDFKIDLFQQQSPQNVNNFIFLAEEGFYNDLPFHRVIPDFIIQTGYVADGGVRYTVPDEVSREVGFDDYTVAMANEGEPNTNKSQFFITLSDSEVEHLEGEYTIIGRVVEGFRVIENIGSLDVDDDYVPFEEVFIESLSIQKESL